MFKRLFLRFIGVFAMTISTSYAELIILAAPTIVTITMLK